MQQSTCCNARREQEGGWRACLLSVHCQLTSASGVGCSYKQSHRPPCRCPRPAWVQPGSVMAACHCNHRNPSYHAILGGVVSSCLPVWRICTSDHQQVFATREAPPARPTATEETVFQKQKGTQLQGDAARATKKQWWARLSPSSTSSLRSFLCLISFFRRLREQRLRQPQEAGAPTPTACLWVCN